MLECCRLPGIQVALAADGAISSIAADDIDLALSARPESGSLNAEGCQCGS
jgi:hypothetical protein